MLSKGIVEESKSPWNFPLIVVPKKSINNEVKWRVVVDFRRLNDATINEVFPLPNITDILDQLGKSSYFSTLDLESAYHQIDLDINDREKTAFSTTQGHYHFKKMCFGLKNAPATFQRHMNTILSGLIGIKCFVYLDDVVVYGYNLADHNEKLSQILKIFRFHKLKLNPQKCEFLSKNLCYLGHIITPNGIKPDPKKTEAVVNYPTPANTKDVKAFLGFVGYYRRFIPNFSHISEPLNKLLRKRAEFKWDEFCFEAFSKLKNSLISLPILQYPDFEKTFTITCDASDVAIGSVLSQSVNSSDLPIAYASRVLNNAERNYSSIEKELLAVVWSVERFRPYVFGRHFWIITDHKPLVWLCSMKNPTSRLTRWRIRLDEFDFTIQHKSGKLNVNADALSRIKLNDDKTDPVSTDIFAITRSHIKNQINNTVTPNLSYVPCSNLQSSVSPATASTFNRNNSLNQPQLSSPILSKPNDQSSNNSSSSEDDDIIQPNSPLRKHKPVLLVDQTDIQNALHQYHEGTLGGHQGVLRTYNRMRYYVKFKNMLTTIKKYIKSCNQCQRNKSKQKIKLPMCLTTTSSAPFEKIFLDIFSLTSPSHSGNKCVLTLQDDLSKFSQAFPLPNQEANTVARALVENFICVFGAPKYILTDQGSNFISDVFKNVCKLLKITKLQTSAYHPQSNGALEKSHNTLVEFLRTCCEKDYSNWDNWLPYAMFIYNSTPHHSTKLMPYEILFGIVPNIPTGIKQPTEPVYNYDDYSKELKFRLQSMYNLAKENINKSKNISKRYYDRNSKTHDFNVDDFVLLNNEGRKDKLSPLRLGPYRITNLISDENIEILIGKKPKIVHKNRLIKYQSPL